MGGGGGDFFRNRYPEICSCKIISLEKILTFIETYKKKRLLLLFWLDDFFFNQLEIKFQQFFFFLRRDTLITSATFHLKYLTYLFVFLM